MIGNGKRRFSMSRDGNDLVGNAGVVLLTPGGSMFRSFAWLAALFVFLVLLGGCGIGWDPGVVPETITDEELVEVSKQMRIQGDTKHTVATGNNKYAVRLARLTDRFRNEDGLDLNCKAYITPDVSTNATADGSIRVCSGLMDLMTDSELLFVIGHEIGHIANGDSLDKIRMAYASFSVIKADGASDGQAGRVLNSIQFDDLLYAVLNEQFSQVQESDADVYSYNLMKKYKIDIKAAVSSLRKLGDGGTDLLTSHPGSADRAKAIQAMIDADKRR